MISLLALVAVGVGATQSGVPSLDWNKLFDAEPGKGIGDMHALVTRIVDGDTIEVMSGAERERVRLIGIDTPETGGFGRSRECFGQQATAFNRTLLTGKTVTLRFDTDKRDNYDRLLAYVYRKPDGLFVNDELVKEGFAKTFSVPPNTKYAAVLQRSELKAERERRGLWKAC